MNSILRHVAQLLKYETDTKLEELYTKTAWMFDRKYGRPGASYDAFKHAVTLVVLCLYIYHFDLLICPLVLHITVVAA